MPALPREEIDRAVWHYFETVGLDYDAMVREDEERRSLRLAEIAAQLDAARAELRRAEERLERVRRDYLDGKLTAEHWEDFCTELMPETRGRGRCSRAAPWSSGGYAERGDASGRES